MEKAGSRLQPNKKNLMMNKQKKLLSAGSFLSYFALSFNQILDVGVEKVQQTIFISDNKSCSGVSGPATRGEVNLPDDTSSNPKSLLPVPSFLSPTLQPERQCPMASQ